MTKFSKFNKTKYEKHMMCDIETLGQARNSVVLSIGAVVFDPYANDLEQVLQNSQSEHTFTTFYKKINIESCEKLGMVIEDDAIKWWSKQAPEILDAAFSDADREPIEDALKELFVFSRHCTRFWAKSPEFDFIILEYAAKQANLGNPWQYHRCRDVRTIEEISGLSTKSSNTHDALGDAYNQAMTVQKAYAKLGMVRPEWPD